MSLSGNHTGMRFHHRFPEKKRFSCTILSEQTGVSLYWFSNSWGIA